MNNNCCHSSNLSHLTVDLNHMLGVIGDAPTEQRFVTDAAIINAHPNDGNPRLARPL